MKKTLLFLTTIFTLLFVGCSNETDFDAGPNVQKSQSKLRWYGTKLAEVSTRGVANGDKRWNQMNGVTVKFLNQPSDPTLLSQVITIAKEWEEYAGIKFNFVDADKAAAVRIAFDWQGNDWLTWSYTGNEAMGIRNQSEPTSVFGGLDPSDEEVLRGDVLRLFGQVLGLEYEQRHQEWAKNGYWKKESALEKYWMDQFDGSMNLDWNEIREYVFVPLTEANAGVLMQSKEIDEESIMAWPYYSKQQTSNVIYNTELSEGDKTFIATLYPKDTQQLPTIQEAWVDAGYFEWMTKENAPRLFKGETSCWEDGMVGLVITELGRKQWHLPDVRDGEQLTSAVGMFDRGCLGSVPKFNTSNITNFSQMFYSCFSLTNVSNLDTSSGNNFDYMFTGCTSLVTISDLDTSSGINFDYMFTNCWSLVNISKFDTSNCTNFSYMFSACNSLVTIPKLDVSNGTNFYRMFASCSSLTSIPNLAASNGTNFGEMFWNCSSLTSMSNLDTSSGTNFENMFYRCSSLTSVSNLDTSNGIEFHFMFAVCTALVTVSDLDTSNGLYFGYMFADCTSLEKKPNLSYHPNDRSIYSGTKFANDPL